MNAKRPAETQNRHGPDHFKILPTPLGSHGNLLRKDGSQDRVDWHVVGRLPALCRPAGPAKHVLKLATGEGAEVLEKQPEVLLVKLLEQRGEAVGEDRGVGRAVVGLLGHDLVDGLGVGPLGRGGGGDHHGGGEREIELGGRDGDEDLVRRVDETRVVRERGNVEEERVLRVGEALVLAMNCDGGDKGKEWTKC